MSKKRRGGSSCDAAIIRCIKCLAVLRLVPVIIFSSDISWFTPRGARTGGVETVDAGDGVCGVVGVGVVGVLLLCTNIGVAADIGVLGGEVGVNGGEEGSDITSEDRCWSAETPRVGGVD